MATTIWKGHLTFGLVSIPVKLYRAARPEKVSFRQLHSATGARVRQTLVAEQPPDFESEPELEEPPPPRSAAARRTAEPEPFIAPAPARGPIAAPKGGAFPPPAAPQPTRAPEPATQQREVNRSDIVKGYEYERDRYVTLTREELAAITPETAREMEILEFVQLSEVDPIHYETSYYVAPDKGGERAYALLLEALRQSGYVAVAQVAMHNREHVIIIRPGRTGLLLHTMFYETEIRRDDEYRADVSAISAKELELALLLIRNLTAPFEPSKYHDTYREKLDALIQAKIGGHETVQPPAAKQRSVVNILDALQRSLEKTASASPSPKPPAAEKSTKAESKPRRRAGQK